jgi:adenosylmethionine-8-amino-7-oxononanoate aminotransferase
MMISEALAEPFLGEDDMFLHGVTFAGHPVSSAVALANIELMKRENLLQNVLDNEAGMTAHLRRLEDLPIVGDVRGEGYLQVVELVRDPVTLETFSPEECKWLLKGLISNRLFEEGLMCRTDDRAEPLIVLSPPLIAGEREFALIESVLRTVLTEAWDALQSRSA